MGKTLSRKQLWIYLLIWLLGLAASGLHPEERLTWWLEIFPILIATPVLLWTHREFPLPRYIYFWIFIHGLVLMVGGHYTYAHVPLGDWLRGVLHLSRNPFDRIGHLFQGFVPALIANEILSRKRIVTKPGWRCFLTLTVCMAISMLYEFVEWWSALLLGLGAEAFLGTQGDPWDTQWDMLCATVGALAAIFLYRLWRQRPAASA